MAVNLAQRPLSGSRARLRTYWASRHRGDRPPSRRDIDPIVELPDLVSHLMLIDCLPDRFVYRLVGSALVNFFGVDTTGRVLGTTLPKSPVTAIWLDALNKVRTQAAETSLNLNYNHRTAVNELIFLPLCGDDRTVEMILGGCFFDGVAHHLTDGIVTSDVITILE